MTPEELRKRRRARKVEVAPLKSWPWPDFDRDEITRLTQKVREEVVCKCNSMFPDIIGWKEIREKYIEYETKYEVQRRLSPFPIPYKPNWY